MNPSLDRQPVVRELVSKLGKRLCDFSGRPMNNLTSRKEFRDILADVVQSTRTNLDRPGITPFTAEEVFRWFQQITIEDVRAVFDDPQRGSKAS